MKRELKLNALGRWRLSHVRLACSKCPRAGQYATRRLIARYGEAIEMPQLMSRLVVCDRRSYSDHCGAFFPDLATDDSGALPELVKAYGKLNERLRRERG